MWSKGATVITWEISGKFEIIRVKILTNSAGFSSKDFFETRSFRLEKPLNWSNLEQNDHFLYNF